MASNHTSFLDPIALGVASPRQLHFMGKEDLFKDRYFGKLLSMVNVFPTKRQESDVSALREAIRRLKEDKVLLLFPEGTRTQGGSIGEAKLGVGLLAVRTRVPVIPTFIKGGDKALPRDAIFIRLKGVSVHFGREVFFNQLELKPDIKETYRMISETVMDEIAQLKEKVK